MKKELLDKYKVIWEKEAHRCSKCGKCRSFCPVFVHTLDEKMGTRGRISLAAALSSGQIDFTPEFIRSISTCMRCLRCSRECPSLVDFDKLIRGVRGAAGETVFKYRVSKKIVKTILLNRPLLDLLAFCSYVSQKFLPRGNAAWIKKLPFFYRGAPASPRFAKRSAIKSFAGRYPVENHKYRVMFYTGCVINYLYPHLASDVIEVLNHLGVEVIISDEELCCGIPAISYGDFDTAKKLASRNIDVAAKLKVDYIVSACGTCVNTFKKDYPEIAGEKAKEFVSKAVEISYFINNILKADFEKSAVKATYHDPCHLNFGLNITKEPRELIAAAADFVEMKNADKCCGMAGSFGIMNCGLSKKIFSPKAEAVIASKAEAVITACPSCMMQLKGQLADAGVDVEVLHIVELLKRGIKKKEGISASK